MYKRQVLDEYSAKLRDKKLEHLQRYITDGLEMLLHKKDFIDKVSIDKETFEVKLYKGEDEITKSMLSKGELQCMLQQLSGDWQRHQVDHFHS